MVPVLTIASPHRDDLLLPVLEGLSLVEILHTVKTAAHQLASILFLFQLAADSIPKLS